MVGGVTSGLTRGGLCTQYLPDLQGVPSDTTVAVRGVTNTFHLGFEACFTEGNPYLALNQMPRSGEAVATLILPNSPIVKLPSKYLIFVYTHCSQPWSKKKKHVFAASIGDSERLRALRIKFLLECPALDGTVMSTPPPGSGTLKKKSRKNVTAGRQEEG